MSNNKRPRTSAVAALENFFQPVVHSPTVSFQVTDKTLVFVFKGKEYARPSDIISNKPITALTTTQPEGEEEEEEEEESITF